MPADSHSDHPAPGAKSSPPADSGHAGHEPMVAVRVRLRIHELMAEKGIRSVAALHRILLSKHVPVSHSQLLRIVDNRAESWKVEFIAAFLDIFQCNISDLFKVEAGPAQKQGGHE